MGNFTVSLMKHNVCSQDKSENVARLRQSIIPEREG